MPGYAPESIRACFEAVKREIPSVQLGGIYGNWKTGYHNSRAENPPNNYSVQRPDDKRGDAWAGSALDLTFPNPADIRQCTGRLITATKAKDPRVWCLREFFGTVDSKTVTGLDVRDNRWVTSDTSHLWHIHLSFYRLYATDKRACLGVAEVITGKTTGMDSDMTPEETEKMIAQAFRAYHLGSDGTGRFTPKKYPNWVKNAANGIGDRLTRLERKVKP